MDDDALQAMACGQQIPRPSESLRQTVVLSRQGIWAIDNDSANEKTRIKDFFLGRRFSLTNYKLSSIFLDLYYKKYFVTFQHVLFILRNYFIAHIPKLLKSATLAGHRHKPNVAGGRCVGNRWEWTLGPPMFSGEVAHADGTRRRATGPAHLSATFSGSGAAARAGSGEMLEFGCCGHHIHFPMDTHLENIYVFVNIRIYTSLYVHMHIYIDIFLYIHIYMYVFLCVFILAILGISWVYRYTLFL